MAPVGQHIKNSWDAATVEELILENRRLKMRDLSSALVL
jgi:hypothetical protein